MPINIYPTVNMGGGGGGGLPPELEAQLTTPVAITATEDGAGTGVIPAPGFLALPLIVHVTADGSGEDIVTLPSGQIGMQIVVEEVGGPGNSYVIAVPTGDYLNNVPNGTLIGGNANCRCFSHDGSSAYWWCVDYGYVALEPVPEE